MIIESNSDILKLINTLEKELGSINNKTELFSKLNQKVLKNNNSKDIKKAIKYLHQKEKELEKESSKQTFLSSTGENTLTKAKNKNSIRSVDLNVKLPYQETDPKIGSIKWLEREFLKLNQPLTLVLDGNRIKEKFCIKDYMITNK